MLIVGGAGDWLTGAISGEEARDPFGDPQPWVGAADPAAAPFLEALSAAGVDVSENAEIQVVGEFVVGGQTYFLIKYRASPLVFYVLDAAYALLRDARITSSVVASYALSASSGHLDSEFWQRIDDLATASDELLTGGGSIFETARQAEKLLATIDPLKEACVAFVGCAWDLVCLAVSPSACAIEERLRPLVQETRRLGDDLEALTVALRELRAARSELSVPRGAQPYRLSVDPTSFRLAAESVIGTLPNAMESARSARDQIEGLTAVLKLLASATCETRLLGDPCASVGNATRPLQRPLRVASAPLGQVVSRGGGVPEALTTALSAAGAIEAQAMAMVASVPSASR